MAILYEERVVDSPAAATIARIQAISNGYNMIPADGHWYLYTNTLNGKTTMTVGGPMTKAVSLPHEEGADSIGIRLPLGTYVACLPVHALVDSAITLPDASSKSFWLDSSAWEFPTHDNADVFVEWLLREGLLARDPVVAAALRDEPQELSLRSVQRRFLQTTGVTHTAIRQIERARHATALLQQGMSILDTVFEAGYYDQAHLTRSLKVLTGYTPAQLLRVPASR
jgi:hypothetical protein